MQMPYPSMQNKNLVQMKIKTIACITGLILTTILTFSCKEKTEATSSLNSNNPTRLIQTSSTDEVFTCVSQLNKTQEVELYIVRHSDGSIDVTRTIRDLSNGMLPRSYSLDNNITSVGNQYGIYLDSSDYVFIPFGTSDEVKDFGNDVPDGGLVIVTCVCCASADGSAMGCAVNADNTGKFINCYNGTGDCWTSDNTTDCSAQTVTGSGLPITMWGVIMKGNKNATIMN